MNVDIAYRLSKLRRERGLSQEGLAEKLGVSRQAVSKWERAESSPDTDNLIALADIYGMTLDGLLKGDPECADEEDSGATASGDESTPEDGAAPEDGATDGGGADSGDGTDAFFGHDADDGGDHVHMSLRDGIHVRDHDGSEVHVGWDGIHVDAPAKGDKVDIDSSGVHVNDHDGHDVHTNDDGSVEVDGRRYANWREAKAALHEPRHRSWMSRFPYGAIAFVGFICMGVFAGMWKEGLIVLFSAGVWGCAAEVVDAFSGGRSARKRRASVTALIGGAFVFAFVVVGLLFGAWHPGWVLILIGIAACGIVKACWAVGKGDDDGSEGDPSEEDGD
ncbi:MAG: helix-turn-helix domain-containing protein [Atopobiaceae bacterium]|jgi:HTH-type transcriptional regulator/antitoxin HipB|nr:helix-turn-helix domain-containing protein [Atopobiaceae bacterium]MCI2173709.1 helix-turn-helix domain-containing protein [Atopobiaceae bacterium]MCI2207649.1 helix-turn-helix domain-containing protein [Atopobiaceae bacterium]